MPCNRESTRIGANKNKSGAFGIDRQPLQGCGIFDAATQGRRAGNGLRANPGLQYPTPSVLSSTGRTATQLQGVNDGRFFQGPKME